MHSLKDEKKFFRKRSLGDESYGLSQRGDIITGNWPPFTGWSMATNLCSDPINDLSAGQYNWSHGQGHSVMEIRGINGGVAMAENGQAMVDVSEIRPRFSPSVPMRAGYWTAIPPLEIEVENDSVPSRWRVLQPSKMREDSNSVHRRWLMVSLSRRFRRMMWLSGCVTDFGQRSAVQVRKQKKGREVGNARIARSSEAWWLDVCV